MYDIKPIPTIYKGQKFRSRIEAKWAVLFDLLKIVWVYEPDGFELSTGKYLPDFYLPEYEAFVEVKPYYIKGDKQVAAWLEKGRMVANLTGKTFLFLFGNPNLLPTVLFDKDWECHVLPFIDKHKQKYGHWFFTGSDIGEEDYYLQEEFEQEIITANSYKF